MADTPTSAGDPPQNANPVDANSDDVEEIIDINSKGGGEGMPPDTDIAAKTAGKITAELLKNPMALAKMQDQLGAMIGRSSGYIQSLPKEVKRRIDALKNLQYKHALLEQSFFEEVHALEKKFAERYATLFDSRRDIIGGDVEPTDEDSEWPQDEEEEEAEEADNKPAEPAKEEATENGTTSGIPEFWLTVFKNIEIISDMIQPHDEAILKHLIDIRVQYDSPDFGTPNFTLEFHFSPNDYFNNTVLTKVYNLEFGPERTTEGIVSYEGPEIQKCQGCSIDWKKGKNVTVKLVKKKQKHKSQGQTRTITKTVQNDSFFNFFSPPDAPASDAEDDEEADDETNDLLAADYEIGMFFRDRIVPKAVLYFTGEATEEDYDDDDDEEEEEEDYDGSGDDEDDPDFKPTGKPEECKQQ